MDVTFRLNYIIIDTQVIQCFVYERSQGWAVISS